MFSSNTSQQSEGYQIQRSLRFNSADSAYLNRTPASAGNRKTWTWSGWVKRSSLDSFNMLFATSNGQIYFDQQKIDVTLSPGAGIYVTTAVYRDVSAWYHIVVACDTTQATAANRLKLYVNGVQVTDFGTSTAIAQNADTYFNDAVEHDLGRFPSSYYLNGYMTEINFIDGQALTPSSFGQTNSDTGVWEPKPYAGTYGTNGFYLNFSDNSNTTATTLGKDYSGNGNNWTPNNFSVSAGAGNDSLVDVPTAWGTDTGVGGTVRGNYATLNPLITGNVIAPSNGNLDAVVASASPNAYFSTVGTIPMSSGKWYWECLITARDSSAGQWFQFGIVSSVTPYTNNGVGFSGAMSAGLSYINDGNLSFNGGSSTYGASFTTSDVIGVAVDFDANQVTFYKNGVSQGTVGAALTTAFAWLPIMQMYRSTTATNSAWINFGQRPFAFAAPSGFKALCAQNLPTPTIGATASTQAGKFFNPVLYTGTGSARSVTGVGFQPDLVWIKNREASVDHGLIDAVRGAGKFLFSNLTNAEGSFPTDFVSFDSNGFSLGTGTGSVTNTNGVSYVAWNWKANGAGVTNTSGSITSTVSANTTSGFSIAAFTGVTGGGTVGHGLGVAPSMIIVKSRNYVDCWVTYHASLGADKYLVLNETSSVYTNTSTWKNTAPTSTVFSVGDNAFPNGWTEVAYCFAEVPGYSKFGSYTGNDVADGVFVYTGFMPKYILVKCSSTATDWIVWDSARTPTNQSQSILYPNGSFAEGSGASVAIDFLSNGFKLRGRSVATNGPQTYIFAAFAEAPQKFALAR